MEKKYFRRNIYKSEVLIRRKDSTIVFIIIIDYIYQYYWFVKDTQNLLGLVCNWIHLKIMENRLFNKEYKGGRKSIFERRFKLKIWYNLLIIDDDFTVETRLNKNTIVANKKPVWILLLIFNM